MLFYAVAQGGAAWGVPLGISPLLVPLRVGVGVPELRDAWLSLLAFRAVRGIR